MKSTEDTNQIEEAYKEAYQMGKHAGANGAYWTSQHMFNKFRQNDQEVAKKVLAMIDDCDPAFWNNIELPDLSGQHADGLTAYGLYAELCYKFKLYTHEDTDDFDDDEYPIDDCLYTNFCTQYEMGVSDGFTDTLVEILKGYLDNN